MLLLLFNTIPRVYFDDYRYISLKDRLYNIVSTPIEYLISENTTNNFIKDD